MNSTRNKKIEQVKETTMIVGIDIGSEKHYFRAFNWRGIELTRKPVAFSNSMEGFNSFYNTIARAVLSMRVTDLWSAIMAGPRFWSIFRMSPSVAVKYGLFKGLGRLNSPYFTATSED